MNIHVIKISFSGEKIVFVPFHQAYHMNCREERYQPFKFWANVSSQCVLQKSKCNEIGQVIYYNGTLLEDRLCRCDYKQGFAFVTKPQNRCYCNLAKEDCTCYKKQCSGLLTPGKYEKDKFKTSHLDSRPILYRFFLDSFGQGFIQEWNFNFNYVFKLCNRLT